MEKALPNYLFYDQLFGDAVTLSSWACFDRFIFIPIKNYIYSLMPGSHFEHSASEDICKVTKCLHTQVILQASGHPYVT